MSHLPPVAPIVPQLGPLGLPVAVRAALWCTHALAGRVDPVDLPEHAAAGLDAVSPAAADALSTSVSAWRDVGERVVLAALPRPGRPGQLPVGAAALGAATSPGSVGLLLAPTLGDAFVLHLEAFGHGGGDGSDGGWLLHAERVACDPVPAPLLERMDLRTATRALAAATRQAAGTLEDLAAPPVWTGTRAGGLAVSTASDLPPGLSGEVVDLLERAAAVAAMTALGQDTHAVHGHATAGRRAALLPAHYAALDALEAGSLAAATALRGNPSVGGR